MLYIKGCSKYITAHIKYITSEATSVAQPAKDALHATAPPAGLAASSLSSSPLHQNEWISANIHLFLPRFHFFERLLASTWLKNKNQQTRCFHVNVAKLELVPSESGSKWSVMRWPKTRGSEIPMTLPSTAHSRLSGS